MKRLNSSIAKFAARDVELVRLQKAREAHFKNLFPALRKIVLNAIYDMAGNTFPYKYERCEVWEKLKKEGFDISWDLFWDVVERFGHSEKCHAEDGSFNIEHYYCNGKVKLD